MNIHGQTKLPTVKQLQIQDFIKYNHVDILHMQECEIGEDTFASCDTISSNFNLISNNSENQYGTASLVRSDLSFQNVRCDTSGRGIVFDIGTVSFGNFYLQSGTDSYSRANRESFCAITIPNLITNSQPSGCLGGDFNMIINKQDATAHPAAKMSPTFQKIVQTFEWVDSFRVLHPTEKQFSRYYGDSRSEGATRIDRSYHYGDITIKKAIYLPIAFSDHHAHLVTVEVPNPFSKLLCPRPKPAFRIKTEVVQDKFFQQQLAEQMTIWQNVRSFGLPVLPWWESLVKPGIKKLAQKRSRELNKLSKEEFNLLRLRQGYLNRKLLKGETWRLGALRAVNEEIEQWYSRECSKIKYQSLADEHQNDEKVRVYHHSLHRKKIKKSSILKLDTASGTLLGHKDCSKYLEDTVEDLLLHPAVLDQAAQDSLLNEVEPVFSDSDNQKLLKVPTKAEIYDTICASNLQAAPGTDGLTSFFYKQCFEIVGNPLTEVVRAVFNGNKPTLSQRTSKMVFGSKPKKVNSTKPSDKRRISLLNCDFKIISGLESRRLKATATRTLSPYQLVAGDDRQIHHGINLARDAIQAVSKSSKIECGIADTDYQAAFDFLVMTWVFLVLEKKGLSEGVINRLKNLYQDNLSIVVVNNIEGKCVKNLRLSLRQGDIPSMYFFAFGIDPLITYLSNRLSGILITSLPVLGPVPANSTSATIPPMEERYKVISYADDLKPAITSLEEFKLVNYASALFEAASGCKLHRDPASQKCKFLPLGKWKTKLKQTDLPEECQYFVLSDYLDMVGVQLRANWIQTRKANGDILQERVSNTINPWRGGKFMPLTMRPHSINSYALCKVWFRCGSVDLREGDIAAITKSFKSWLYADLYEKPSEAIMYRPAYYGGLGITSVKYKAKAMLIRTFLETAVHPRFKHSLLHSTMFRYHVMGDTTVPDPGLLPYYQLEFFDTIKRVYQDSPGKVPTMSIKEWTQHLTEENLTMDRSEPRKFNLCRVESQSPNSNWSLCWNLSRLRGLGSDLTSFNFKLLHKLLVTKSRLHDLNPAVSNICPLCTNAPEDLAHALITCSFNNNVGNKIVEVVKTEIPDISIQEILRLELTDMPEDMVFPTIFVLTFTLKYIWEKRMNKIRISSHETRANLEARCIILRKTRYEMTIPKITRMLANL